MIGLALRTAKLRSAFVSFILFTFFGGIAGVIWYGGSLVQQGTITVGDFATFLIYAMFVLIAIQSMRKKVPETN